MGCFRNRNLFLFGIILALLINTKGLKYKSILADYFVITMAVPPFVSLLIMRNLLNGSGPINALLLNWGLIDSSIPFLQIRVGKINHYCCQYVDWYSCYDVNLYRDYQNLPEDQIEAARIDGANKWQILKVLRFHKFYL